ncbi:hypothetical protein [Lacihabitans soyangensis]|nr:hypothetical protein [Lacihabitans soyangensis]
MNLLSFLNIVGDFGLSLYRIDLIFILPLLLILGLYELFTLIRSKKYNKY